jgi:hypothetical protein
MKILLATAVTALFLLIPFAAMAGGGLDTPEQMALPQTKVVVVQPNGDNTAAYVAAAAVVVAAGIGYLGVRKNRRG